MATGWDIIEIKRQIAQLHNRGAVSNEVVSLVVDNGVCAPVESEIFDYKETQEDSPTAIAKLIRHIVSFYNSYGGYLLFGVQEEESETLFNVVGVPENLLELESLKAKIRDFVGERIQISGTPIPSITAAGMDTYLYLLFIPKRPENDRPPVHFHKDGPGQVFKKDDIYCRVGDECIEAKGPRLFELSLPRPNPYLTAHGSWNFEKFITRRIENNLPDRNFVCPKFIGREIYLDKLWRWLGDDLSHVKMLAGEGGLGKSSIAYEFADRVSQIQNIPFEQVVWLTAKRKQFVGQYDDYISVPETHYSTYEELIRTILKHLPILIEDEELGSMSLDELKRQIRDGLAAYPSFLVVDDIDSLDAEQQRQVVELGFVLGSVKSKLLLTTRHNLAYSHDLAIQIGGFEESEFLEYLTSLRERNVLQREISTSEQRKLYETTHGSPLYTESVCRLFRFQPFDDAIKGWGKDAGARVRAAALDREVSMLSPESRRVLLSAALLSEASIPELSEATEYPQELVQRCIQELSSLFLLAGETLADQPRFTVPDNATRLVAERASTLVTDHKRIENKVKQIRSGTKTGKGNDSRVAFAISQAQSLLRYGDIQGALSTVDDARKRIKGNADLLGFRAEVLMKFVPPKFDEARRNARDAYHANCRRPATFFAWFEAEWAAEHFIGAAECAEAAIENSVPGNGDWWIKLAAAHVCAAEAQKVGVALSKRIDKFFEASTALCHALKAARGPEAKQWEGIQFDIHDKIWSLLANNLDGLDTIDIAAESLERIWKAGDFRFTNANHALVIGWEICSFLESSSGPISGGKIRAAEIRLDRCRKLIKNRISKYPEDSRHRSLEETLNRIFERFSNIADTIAS